MAVCSHKDLVEPKLLEVYSGSQELSAYDPEFHMDNNGMNEIKTFQSETVFKGFNVLPLYHI